MVPKSKGEGVPDTPGVYSRRKGPDIRLLNHITARKKMSHDTLCLFPKGGIPESGFLIAIAFIVSHNTTIHFNYSLNRYFAHS